MAEPTFTGPFRKEMENFISLKRSVGYLSLIHIFSGYNDFSYAKEAIQLGVVDYLLKPIDTPSLNQALEKCVRQIEQTRQHRNALETIKKAQLRKTLR